MDALPDCKASFREDVLGEYKHCDNVPVWKSEDEMGGQYACDEHKKDLEPWSRHGWSKYEFGCRVKEFLLGVLQESNERRTQ